MAWYDQLSDWWGDSMSGTAGNVLDPGGFFTGELKRKKQMEEYAKAAEGLAGEYNVVAEEAAKAMEALAAGLDPKQLTPAQYQALQDFHPEVAQYVAEQAPNLMQAGGVGRDLMMEQAQAARQMYSEGDTPAARAARELQMMDASALQQQLLSKLQAQAAQEGRATPQTDLMMALGVGKQAQDALYRQQLQAQSQGDNLRLQALQMMGSAGAGIQANDQSAQRTNTDILNSYNQRLARTKWDYEQNRANELNRANMYNIQQKQTAADKNVAERNKAQQDYINQKLGLQTGAIKTRSEGKQQGIASRAQAAQAKAGFDVGSASRQQGDAQQGGNLITSIIGAFK